MVLCNKGFLLLLALIALPPSILVVTPSETCDVWSLGLEKGELS